MRAWMKKRKEKIKIISSVLYSHAVSVDTVIDNLKGHSVIFRAS